MVSSSLNKQGNRAFLERKRGKEDTEKYLRKYALSWKKVQKNFIIIKINKKKLSTSYQQVINRLSTTKSLEFY